VIKVEAVSRVPEQFYYECKVQREIAKTGFSCNIEEIEVNEYPRYIYGKEKVGMAWFYIIVMPKLDYSLKDMQDKIMVFDIETI
jgi:hypothetical protein